LLGENADFAGCQGRGKCSIGRRYEGRIFVKGVVPQHAEKPIDAKCADD
jgi:hypothetical protein